MIGTDRVGLHQRHDHEASAERERPDLQRRPRQRERAPDGRHGRGQPPRLDAQRSTRESPGQQLGGAAADQHEHQPRPREGCRGAPGERVSEHPPAAQAGRAHPDRPGDADPGKDRHSGDDCARAGTRAAQPGGG